MPLLRITADAGLSEELRHKARHKHERKPRARGARLVWVDPSACVYVAAIATAGHSARLRGILREHQATSLGTLPLKEAKEWQGITFLDYENCPRTTNHVERANRYYRKPAKSHYRNRTKRAIWNMVKSDLMTRKLDRGCPPVQQLT